MGFDLPVRVIESGLELLGGDSRLKLRFDESAQATLTTGDLQLTNLTTGLTIPAATLALAYQADSNTAFVSFPGLAGGRLANGLHRLVLPAGAVTDPAGNPLDTDYVYDFRVLDGDSDADHDGMVNTWERTNLLNPLDPADAGSDADADGQSNLNEYRSGTDPRDPVSRLVIAAATQGVSSLNVTWRSVPGRQYRLQGSSDLLAWTTLTQGGQPLVADASATGEFTEYAIPLAGNPPSGFQVYRIEAVIP